MTMKRMIALTICAVMLLAMIPTGILTAGADGTEGDWTTYRFANEYHDPGEDPWNQTVYKPEAGYQYTDEGFSTIAPDYTEFTPAMTVITKEPVRVKKGLYLQFRVDDFSYDGGVGMDEWIALTLSTEGKVAPGSTAYGGGWMSLIRGNGNGHCTMMPHLTDPRTEVFGGTFTTTGVVSAEVPVDEQGREIYTLEVIWNGREYEIKVNGVVQPGSTQTTALLEKLNSDGEFYVGINMLTMVKDGTAALTILKCGTCEEDAVTPMGSDYKEPEENWLLVADIADPAAVPEGQPAILWSPETYDLRDGWNVSFAPQGDNTWHATVSDRVAYWSFKPENTWSYAAEDFPVFGMLFRNIWVDGGDLWYSAGDVIAPSTDCSRFSYYDGQVYTDQEGQEYVFIPVDLTGLWAGRINNIRLDFCFEDESCREFDICFAGMFRSVKEAYDYTEEYLVELGILTESVSETDPVVEPDPDPDDSKPDDSKPDDSKPDDSKPDDSKPGDSKPGGSENKVPESENAESETLDDMEFIMTTLGCTGSVSGGAVLVLLIGAVLLKKKEN